ncbi:MAG TPA: bile acid:sodium symporter family protein [Stellaceae bacterium]|jgi:sodium/bile acid cotransporter 7|nr:bile acid:sodium symporter family protein [Stellaceae bacterium]
MFKRLRLRVDNFLMLLVGMVVLASILPARGSVAPVFATATDIAIGLLFFLHGARLSRQAILQGITHWRLHITVFLATFGLFPLLGLALEFVPSSVISPNIVLGIVFLCCLPSTVQSSIAFTSIAGGNVPAAICSASASNLFGIVITPLLVGLLIRVHGSALSVHTVTAIMEQLFLPFIVGHLLRPVIGGFISRHGRLTGMVDRGSILMVVYGAFSAAVVAGLWHEMSLTDFAALIVADTVLLLLVLAITTYGSRALRFRRADEITIVFCGSKKSLASGTPIAAIMFPAHTVGALLLPLMFFHQIQLMVCAAMAQRYARRRGEVAAS